MVESFEDISMTSPETVATHPNLEAMHAVQGGNDGSEWGLILAVVLIGAGVGNLLAAYSIIRFYRWREKQKKELKKKQDQAE